MMMMMMMIIGGINYCINYFSPTILECVWFQILKPSFTHGLKVAKLFYK